jgi:hypothetical protein
LAGTPLAVALIVKIKPVGRGTLIVRAEYGGESNDAAAISKNIALTVV